MIVAPATQHPLQAMMLSARGETLPLSSSFQRPAEDRTIRKAIMLVDDSAYSHLERESLVRVLESNRIEYTIVDGSNRTADELLECIELENPDLIWFIGHGEFDHYAAHKSAIISSIRLEWSHFERLRTNSKDGRRLVILNICSGGAPATDESPANTGIGPIIASSNNAVVGHLWDINPLVGATFGALLALELGKQTSFFEAFCAAVSALRKSRKDIESTIRSAGLPELADRVVNSDSIPFEDIASWGSPVFWE